MNAGNTKTSFFTWLKNIDAYGSRAQVNFRGHRTYKTGVGAIATILSLALILSYSAIRLERWINHKNTDVVSNIILKDMSQDLFMNAADSRF